MIIYFDTSSYTWLSEDLNKDYIIDKINKELVFTASPLNFIEISCTRDLKKRNNLLNLFQQLNRNKDLLGLPSELLFNSYYAYLYKTKYYNKFSEHSSLINNFINNPNLINDKDLKLFKTIKDFEFKSYLNLHNIGKKFLLKAINKSGIEKIIKKNFSIFLKLYCNNNDFLNKIVFDFLKPNISKIQHNIDNGFKIFNEFETWRNYFSAMAYGIFMHSILKENSYKNYHPGSIDIQQSIYLSMCDIFVTGDFKQNEMLILLSYLNPKTKKNKILLFNDFKEYLYKF